MAQMGQRVGILMANWTPASPSLVGTSCLWPDHWISQAYQKKVVSGLRSLTLWELRQPQKKETKPTPGGRK